MNYFKGFLYFLLIILVIAAFFYIPMKEVLSFTETRTQDENIFYIPMNDQRAFEIRYVHSIHLTDVIESYEITEKGKLRMVSMTYENLAIGMPSVAGEGETLDLKDGVYTLTYKDNVLDSFRLHIGRVDADLAIRYNGREIDLKKYLERGKSYEFNRQRLTLYQMMKGAQLDD